MRQPRAWEGALPFVDVSCMFCLSLQKERDGAGRCFRRQSTAQMDISPARKFRIAVQFVSSPFIPAAPNDPVGEGLVPPHMV